MATYRIGIGSFNLKDGAVGIGTESSGLGNLKVEGTYKTTDLDVTGVSTFTRYAGFAADNIPINVDRTLTGEHFTTGDIVVGVNSTFTVSAGATVDVGTVPSVSIGTHFSPPTGDINDRPEVPVEGTVRFNKDLNTLEFYNGVEWRQFTVSGARGRGVFSSYTSPNQTAMQYIEIMTLGNAQDFGTNTGGQLTTGNSDGTRGTFSGGSPSPYKNLIEYITIASQGNPIDFGDLTLGRAYSGGASSSTRGLIIGGYTNAYKNTIDYIEIQTLGNALDFGDCVQGKPWGGSTSSPTRGVYMSGSGGSGVEALVETVNIASKGNAIEFGETTQNRRASGGGGNSVRGIFVGGYLSNALIYNIMDYVTLASNGNAIDFGDQLFSGSYSSTASNNVRMVTSGGYHAPSTSNVLAYVTIATTGNAVDFGDTFKGNGSGGVSDSHGGLGGY